MENVVYEGNDNTVVALDTISAISEQHVGKIVICGSHGGMSAGEYCERHPASVVFYNDAGFGKDYAGVAGIKNLDECGIIGLGICHTSARIGDGLDTWENGIISFANECAKQAHFRVGEPVKNAVKAYLESSGVRSSVKASNSVLRPMVREVAHEQGGLKVMVMDSISIMKPEDAGHIVISGSNGGVPSAEFVCQFPLGPKIVFFNDAGIGKERAGILGIDILDENDIACAAVSYQSARISDARDMWANGVLSYCGKKARELGFIEGDKLGDAVNRYLELLPNRTKG